MTAYLLPLSLDFGEFCSSFQENYYSLNEIRTENTNVTSYHSFGHNVSARTGSGNQTHAWTPSSAGGSEELYAGPTGGSQSRLATTTSSGRSSRRNRDWDETFEVPLWYFKEMESLIAINDVYHVAILLPEIPIYFNRYYATIFAAGYSEVNLAQLSLDFYEYSGYFRMYLNESENDQYDLIALVAKKRFGKRIRQGPTNDRELMVRCDKTERLINLHALANSARIDQFFKKPNLTTLSNRLGGQRKRSRNK